MSLSKTSLRIDTKIVFILVLIAMFASCQSNSRSIQLLQDAEKCVEENPKQSLLFLDSIADPQSMDESNYMKYLLTNVRARLKDNQIITSDSSLLKVMNYFESKKDVDNSALSNFYAGRMYYQNSQFDKAIEHFLKAGYYSDKSQNTSLSARIYNNIGYVYYMQNVLDSAIANYRKALEYTNGNEADADYRRLVSNLAVAYENSEQYDSAFYYFNKSLEISNQLKDPNLEARSLYNYGIMSYQRKLYVDALDYFNQAMSKTRTTKDSLRIYYMKSKAFNTTNQMDSAKFYVNIVNSRLSEISDNYLLEDFYRLFSDYNKKRGDYEEALKYAELQREFHNKRQQSDKSQQILAAEKRVSIALLLKKQEEDKRELYICISILVIFSILVTFLLRYEYLKYKRETSVLKAEITRIKYLPGSYKENEKLYDWAKDFLLSQSLSNDTLHDMNHREVLILALFCKGYSNEVIAAVLNIQTNSIADYRSRFEELINKIENLNEEV